MNSGRRQKTDECLISLPSGTSITLSIAHVRHLTEKIGAALNRGGETRGGVLRRARATPSGLREVCLESFDSPRSTYEPYHRAFAALLGTLLHRRWPRRVTALLAAVLSGLAAWGFVAEADLADDWTRLLLPRGTSQNAVGGGHDAGEARQRVVRYIASCLPPHDSAAGRLVMKRWLQAHCQVQTL